MPKGVYLHKPLSEERKTQISQRAKDLGYGLWMMGKRFGEETRAKHRAANLLRRQKFGNYHTPEGTGRLRLRRVEYIIVSCLLCGKPMEKQPSVIRAGRGRFCSRSCSSRYRKGELSPRWKGGTGTERHAAMARLEYKEWRDAVFLRDDFTCQSCGVKGGRIHAHHVMEWAEYPDLRYVVSNGVVLCVPCHREVHTIS